MIFLCNQTETRKNHRKMSQQLSNPGIGAGNPSLAKRLRYTGPIEGCPPLASFAFSTSTTYFMLLIFDCSKAPLSNFLFSSFQFIFSSFFRLSFFKYNNNTSGFSNLVAVGSQIRENASAFVFFFFYF